MAGALLSSVFPATAGGTLAKHATVVLSIVTAVAGVWTRFIVVEQRQDAQLRAITDITLDVQQLRKEVDQLKQDRELWERVHKVELALTTLDERLEELREAAGRPRRKR